jgi:hypothetical protein
MIEGNLWTGVAQPYSRPRQNCDAQLCVDANGKGEAVSGAIA